MSIERVNKCGPDKVALQVNKMFENYSHVPLHHKKTFRQRCTEDPFFKNLDSLLSKQTKQVQDDLPQIRKRFEIENKFLQKINSEMRRSESGVNQCPNLLEIDDEKLLSEMKDVVENIGYIYVCTK